MEGAASQVALYKQVALVSRDALAGESACGCSWAEKVIYKQVALVSRDALAGESAVATPGQKRSRHCGARPGNNWIRLTALVTTGLDYSVWGCL